MRFCDIYIYAYILSIFRFCILYIQISNEVMSKTLRTGFSVLAVYIYLNMYYMSV